MRYYEIPRHEIDYFRKEYEFLSIFIQQRYRLMVFFIAVWKRLIRRRNVCGKRIKSSLLFYVRMKRKSLDKRWKCDRAVTRHNLKLRNRLYTKNSHKILRFRKIC